MKKVCFSILSSSQLSTKIEVSNSLEDYKYKANIFYYGNKYLFKMENQNTFTP